MSIWSDVKKFHRAFKLPVASKPIQLSNLDVSIIVDLKNLQSSLRAVQQKLSVKGSNSTDIGETLRLLRMRLLVEEFTEYLNAEETNDMVEIADALGDMQYITAGTEIAYGINGGAVFKEIQSSNMAKLDKEGNPIYSSDGKVLKPEGWKPPAIARVLKRVSSSGVTAV